MPHGGVQRIPPKSLCLKSHELQVVQKLTARDKQLRSQFAAYNSENNNFLSRIFFFTDEATFQISAHVNRHNCHLGAVSLSENT
jgi:hypothetical protein